MELALILADQQPAAARTDTLLALQTPSDGVFVGLPRDLVDNAKYLAERVSPHKKIRRVEFIDAIPKSPSGKILRRVLVERERKRVAGSRGPAAGHA